MTSGRDLRIKWKLIFDPNFAVIVFFAGNRIKTKEKATPNYSGANMQDSNLVGIEHYRTRESSC